jgi:meso-butanediol dehydrogenase / (S,S)-butanediol dehydrogenase / diacetyl reductase
MRRFEKKCVVITGGNKGIGLAIAERFASEGANLVIGAIETDFSAPTAVLKKYGVGVITQHTDVRKIADIKALFDAADAHFGGVDISVHNAGVITIAKIEDMTEDEWDLNMEVNTKGEFLACQEAIRRFRAAKKRGRIINTGSGQSRDGFIYTPNYAASKFGVIGMTQSLAKEVGSEGITVNAICPGIIETDMWDYNDRVWGKLLGNYKPGELMAEWVSKIPMKRAGKGSDVAALVAFLASEDSVYITGQTINVDGGLIMS